MIVCLLKAIHLTFLLIYLFFNLTLNKANNSLVDDIPTELGKLNNLRALVLAGNNLTNSIPTELGTLSGLKKINLGKTMSCKLDRMFFE